MSSEISSEKGSEKGSEKSGVKSGVKRGVKSGVKSGEKTSILGKFIDFLFLTVFSTDGHDLNYVRNVYY